MSSLGTLWFGADIDLTTLRQKINQGNQSVLDALKMNYDPQSYQQMVSKLRSELGKETFYVKINTDASSVHQALQNTLNSVGSGGNLGGSLGGINAMTKSILDQREAIRDNKAEVDALKESWGKAIKQFGRRSIQAQTAYGEYDKARRDYRNAKYELEGMRIEKGRATLAQKVFNEETKKGSAAIRQLQSDHLRLNTTLAGGIHVSTQLGSALSSLFAIDAARQMLGNVIEIGGQLEKQRISIGAILGDTVKANHLFEQIKGLALQSPFGVMELDQYTKQLSAYGFQYNELFDMTKRLADISAGAGTDIGRLTLALGHVRSATYLTGITLRQFSMNNIPMLKMLADYYTEVEKRAVSTSEVQKRISKRQVSYEDVIEQIRRLTDEGGMFYNMQEKISESLAAKFKNLKDAMDIMYGEMAESFVGDNLKELANVLLKATRRWKEIAAVMGVAMSAFVVSKLRVAANTLAMQGNTFETIKQIQAKKQLEAANLKAASTYRSLTIGELRKIATSTQLTANDILQEMALENLTKEEVLNAIALRKLSTEEAKALVSTGALTQAEVNAALAANRWKVALAGVRTNLEKAFMGVGTGTWATIGLMAGMELYMAWDQWTKRIDDKSNEMKDLLKSRIVDLQKMEKSIKSEGKPKDDVGLQSRVDEMKQVLANSEAYTKTIDDQISKSHDLNEQYDILSKAVEDVAEQNRRALDYQEEAAQLIKASSIGKPTETHWYDYWLGQSSELDKFLFNDDIKKNFEDMDNAYAGLRRTLEGLYEFKEPLRELIDEMMRSGDVSDKLKDKLRDSPFEEQLRLLVENGYWDLIQERLNETGRKFEMTDEEVANASKRMKESFAGVASRWNEITNDDIAKMFNKLVELRGGDEKEVRQWALDNIDDVRRLLDGVLDQTDQKVPYIRKRIKEAFFDLLRLGQLSESMKGLAEGGAFVGDVLGSDLLKRLTDEDEQATLHDRKPENASDSKSKTNKKDEKLEAARNKLSEYQAFLSEYKRYRELYSKEKAIDILETLFPSLKGKGMKLVEDYSSVVGELRNTLDTSTDARKKFQNELSKSEANTYLDREREALKMNADAMKEYVSKVESQWRLYSKIYDGTGNKDLATLAFNEGVVWDDLSKSMLKKLNERGNELGVLPINFRWDMNEEELKEAFVDANGQIQTELVDLAKEIQKVIKGNYVKALEQAAEAQTKVLTNQEKIALLEQKIAEAQKDNSGIDHSAEIKLWLTEIEKLKAEMFELSPLFDKIFGDRTYKSYDALTEAESAAAQLIKNAQETMRNPKTGKVDYYVSFLDDDEGNKIRLTRQQLERLKGTLDSFHKDRGKKNPFKLLADDYKDLVSVLNNKDASPADKQAAWEKFGESISGVAQIVGDFAGQMSGMFDALGNDSMAQAMDDVQAGLNSVQNISKGFAEGGTVGGIIAIAGEAVNWIGRIANAHDRKLDKAIEKSQREVKKLQNAYKNFEWEISHQLTTVTQKQSEEMLRNLQKQERELEDQLSNERKKKKDDPDKIIDLEQQIEEAKQQIATFYEDLGKQRYGLDIDSWAGDLSSAIVDAFIAGEDAADAFDKKVADIMKNVVSNIIKIQVIKPAMDNLSKFLFGDNGIATSQSEGGIEVTPKEASRLVGQLLELKDKVESGKNVYNVVADALQSMGIDWGEEKETSKFGTSSSIKSITEDTADLLASYINAIRADVSVNRIMLTENLPAIAIAVERTNVIAEQQVSQLERISDNTYRSAEFLETIYSLLNRATMDKSMGIYIK